jgi:hypothetical protein
MQSLKQISSNKPPTEVPLILDQIKQLDLMRKEAEKKARPNTCWDLINNLETNLSRALRDAKVFSKEDRSTMGSLCKKLKEFKVNFGNLKSKLNDEQKEESNESIPSGKKPELLCSSLDESILILIKEIKKLMSYLFIKMNKNGNDKQKNKGIHELVEHLKAASEGLLSILNSEDYLLNKCNKPVEKDEQKDEATIIEDSSQMETDKKEPNDDSMIKDQIKRELTFYLSLKQEIISITTTTTTDANSTIINATTDIISIEYPDYLNVTII